MEGTESSIKILPKTEKEEIDWAKYLDHTRFLQPGEINNFSQELFKKDFEEPK
ncbi:MAG: hypothetical protein ACFE8B_16780 [Candidatus Hermodarchaeota archaeon]